MFSNFPVERRLAWIPASSCPSFLGARKYIDLHIALHLLSMQYTWLVPNRGCLDYVASFILPVILLCRDSKWVGSGLRLGTAGLVLIMPSLRPLLQNSHSAQRPTMGRKKIQISRILDQRNRQVSSQVASPLQGAWHSRQGLIQAKVKRS